MARTAKKDKNLIPGKPLKPKGLSDRAAREWDRLTGELEDSGIQVTQAHRTPLLLAATIAADIADAWEVVKKEGAYILSKAGQVQHPAAKRLDALRRDYIKVLATLGIRAAVAVPEETQEETLEDILSGQ